MKKVLAFCLALLCIGTLQAQNVGIGTTTPGAKLDINGTLKVTDGTQGNGKVLTSDSSGMASWQTLPSNSLGDYRTTSICCNTWMTRNLDVAVYRNGDAIPKVTNAATWAGLTTGAYCYYNNDSTTYAATYGKLYNWYAVNDPRGLAPEGWRIPSDFEWTYVSDCLGGEAVAGGKMKERTLNYWNPPNTGAVNISNFTGLAGGYRNIDGSFNSMGNDGFFWSSTEESATHALYRLLFYLNDDLYSFGLSKNFGFSVRCIKD